MHMLIESRTLNQVRNLDAPPGAGSLHVGLLTISPQVLLVSTRNYCGVCSIF